MAITRCPYCRAIIEEKAEYCSNCGTQLLFPEDESAEEEIPGEKIIHAEEEEKDYEIDEPAGEDSGDIAPEEEEEEEEEIDAVEEAGGGREADDGSVLLEEDESDDAGEDAEEEEVIVVDGPVAEEHAEEEKGVESVPLKSEEESGPEEGVLPFPDAESATRIIRLEKSKIKEVFPEKQGAAEEETGAEAGPAQEEEEPEPVPGPKPEPDEETEEAAEAVRTPLTFDTRELDRIGKTSESGSDQLEKILDIFRDKQVPKQPQKPMTSNTDSLPPWAGMIKEKPAAPEEEGEERELADREFANEAAGEEEGYEEEESSEPPAFEISERAADSGIGIPERPLQEQLPLDRARESSEPLPERKPAFEERPGWRDEKEAEEETAREPRPFRPASFIKAKLFDVLFMGVFWLVSLWLASRSMDVSLFQVLAVAGTSSFIFFAVLLVSYFFLFYFFLKETLGDRLFRERD